MFLKICGLTNEADAAHAVAAGATALGVIFAPSSPRCVSADRARDIVEAVPATLPVVGVFAGMIFLGERPGAAEFVALGLVIASLFAVLFQPQEKKPAAAGSAGEPEM